MLGVSIYDLAALMLCLTCAVIGSTVIMYTWPLWRRPLAFMGMGLMWCVLVGGVAVMVGSGWLKSEQERKAAEWEQFKIRPYQKGQFRP